MNKILKNKDQKGFTLIELLVVVAIIGILAAVGIVAFNGFLGSARENSASTNHSGVVRALQARFTQCALGGDGVNAAGAPVLNWNTVNAAGVAGADVEVVCNGNAGNPANHQAGIIGHFNANGFNNPYIAGQGAVVAIASAAADPAEEGQVGIFCAQTAGARGTCTVATITVAGTTVRDTVLKD